MKNLKKFTLGFGAIATLTSPLLVVIACGKEGDKVSDIEKQLLNVRSIQDSEYSSVGLKTAISDLTTENPLNPDVLKITKDALDPGWDVKYYLASSPDTYQEGNLTIKAEIAHQDDLTTTLSKNVVVRPNTNDWQGPTLNHPQQINGVAINWIKDAGTITIAPDATLNTSTIEQAFQTSDNSGEIINPTFTWTTITYPQQENPWSGTNFANEGLYRLLVTAQDSNSNLKNVKLDVQVTNLQNELDQVPNVLTSTKNQTALAKELIDYDLGSQITIPENLGIIISQNPKYNYSWTLKSKLENEEAILTLKIWDPYTTPVPEVSSLSKDIRLRVGYDFSLVLQQLKEMEKTSTLPANELQYIHGSASFRDFGVNWPKFASEIDPQIKVINNDVLNSGLLTTEITLLAGHSQITEQVIIKANQPPTFSLNTETKIGGQIKGATAKVTDQKSGTITLPFNLQFTKEEIVNLVIINDDLDALKQPEITWTLDGIEVTDEIDNQPLEDTTYNLEIIAADTLDQKASYNLVVTIEEDKGRPDNPQWKESPLFGSQIAFEFDPQNQDFAKVIVNQDNFENLPDPSELDQILKQAIEPIGETNQIKYRWTNKSYIQDEGTYQLELWIENTKQIASSGKLTLTINIDTTKPTLTPKQDASLGNNLLDLDSHKLFVNQPELVTEANLKALFIATNQDQSDLNEAIKVDLSNFDSTKENQEQVIIISVNDQNRNQATYELKIEIDTTKPKLQWIDNPIIEGNYPKIETIDLDDPESIEYLSYKIIDDEIKISSDVNLEDREYDLRSLLVYNEQTEVLNLDYSNYTQAQGGVIKIILTDQANNQSILELKVTIVDREINYQIPNGVVLQYDGNDYEIKNNNLVLPNKLKQLIDKIDEEENLQAFKELIALCLDWSETIKEFLNLEQGLFLFSSFGGRKSAGGEELQYYGGEELQYYFGITIYDAYGNFQEFEIIVEFN